jgi:hypothetical protein
VHASAAGVPRELKRLGTVQNVKIYRRHGAGENVCGGGFGDLRPLAKKLGTDRPRAGARALELRQRRRPLPRHDGRRAGRHAMNGVLIAVGTFRPELAPEAIAAAESIGTVEVDHGETGCKTPAAVPYIERALARTKTAATA